MVETPVRGAMNPRRRSRQQLEISREAVRLFRERGVAATSAEQIADAVGLSVRTLWRYFRTKESCVEPVLTITTDAFLDTLRRWPPGTSLQEHLASAHALPDPEGSGDATAALAVIAMSRTEPVLRAIWLLAFERAEPVLAQVIAQRLDTDVDDVAVRVQAAALAAALRITSEGVATGVADPGALLTAAVHAATHGLLGDAVPRHSG